MFTSSSSACYINHIYTCPKTGKAQAYSQNNLQWSMFFISSSINCTNLESRQGGAGAIKGPLRGATTPVRQPFALAATIVKLAVGAEMLWRYILYKNDLVVYKNCVQ